MLPLDCILNYIQFFDIYMLTNYALTYKYGFECIQKHIHNKKIMNNKIKISISFPGFFSLFVFFCYLFIFLDRFVPPFTRLGSIGGVCK